MRVPMCLGFIVMIVAGPVCNAEASVPAKKISIVRSTAGSVYRWKVTNYTDQSLTLGEFYKQEADRTSSLKFGEGTDLPWIMPGEEIDAMQPSDSWSTAKSYTWGRVCYGNLWWNLRRNDPRFEWMNVYIFAVDAGRGEKKLVANPDGAHKDIAMIPTSPCG